MIPTTPQPSRGKSYPFTSSTLYQVRIISYIIHGYCTPHARCSTWGDPKTLRVRQSPIVTETAKTGAGLTALAPLNPLPASGEGTFGASRKGVGFRGIMTNQTDLILLLTLLLFPGSTWEHLTWAAASRNMRQQPTKSIPSLRLGTRTTKYVILLFWLVLSITNSSVASAHNVKTTADVGGTLHIQPNDNPRAGEPSQVWIALTRKGGKVISLKECNCKLAVYAEPHSAKEPALLEPPLQAISAERYQGIPGSEITFPKPGAYQLQLTGKPASGASFQPFKLKFNVTVAAGTTSKLLPQNVQNVNDALADERNGLGLAIAIALSVLAAGGIIFVLLQRRR